MAATPILPTAFNAPWAGSPGTSAALPGTPPPAASGGWLQLIDELLYTLTLITALGYGLVAGVFYAFSTLG